MDTQTIRYLDPTRLAEARARRDAHAPAVALVAMQDACARVLDTCAELARRGCVILAAHVVDGRPKVVVAVPPASAKLAASPRVLARHHAVMATDLDGVQVEWRLYCRPARGGRS